MYSSFSVADLGRAQTLRNPSSGNRSLHGSQSHSNLQFSSSNFGEGFGGASHQQPQQYLPGYLLSATQGKAPPGSPNNFNLQPLEGKESLKRGPSSVAEFGRESLLTAPRPSPKGRSPRPGPTLDENAPPTASIMDVQFNALEPPPHRLITRHSIGGFHPSSSSSITGSSSGNNSMAIDSQPSSSSQGQGYAVTIFGFPPTHQRSVAGQFTSMGEGAVADFPGDEECNWVTVTYANEWEAVRALRKNGDVMGGVIMIGVKWANGDQADPGAQRPAMNASATNEFGQISSPSSGRPSGAATVTGATGASASYSSGRAVKLKPSSSAFHVDQTPAPGGGTPGGKGGDWGLAEQAKRLQNPGQPQSESMFGKVGNVIFGW